MADWVGAVRRCPLESSANVGSGSCGCARSVLRVPRSHVDMFSELVDKGVLRTEKRKFPPFYMATHLRMKVRILRCLFSLSTRMPTHIRIQDPVVGR